MTQPHTPLEYETEDFVITNDNLIKAWDYFADLNADKLDYLFDATRFGVNQNIPLYGSQEYSWLQTSIDRQVDTYSELFIDAECVEFEGGEYDVRVHFYHWWATL